MGSCRADIHIDASSGLDKKVAGTSQGGPNQTGETNIASKLPDNLDNLTDSSHTSEGCNGDTCIEVDYSGIWTKVSKYGRGKHPKKSLFR